MCALKLCFCTFCNKKQAYFAAPWHYLLKLPHKVVNIKQQCNRHLIAMEAASEKREENTCKTIGQWYESFITTTTTTVASYWAQVESLQQHAERQRSPLSIKYYKTACFRCVCCFTRFCCCFASKQYPIHHAHTHRYSEIHAFRLSCICVRQRPVAKFLCVFVDKTLYVCCFCI